MIVLQVDMRRRCIRRSVRWHAMAQSRVGTAACHHLEWLAAWRTACCREDLLYTHICPVKAACNFEISQRSPLAHPLPLVGALCILAWLAQLGLAPSKRASKSSSWPMQLSTNDEYVAPANTTLSTDATVWLSTFMPAKETGPKFVSRFKN